MAIRQTGRMAVTYSPEEREKALENAGEKGEGSLRGKERKV